MVVCRSFLRYSLLLPFLTKTTTHMVQLTHYDGGLPELPQVQSAAPFSDKNHNPHDAADSL